MSSLLNVVREAVRESATGDVNFLKKMLYYFELRLPLASSPAGNVFLFPLVLNPESYSMSEPFTLEQAYTQGAGLHVEENGIIGRTITIQGSTGWKPRKLAQQPLQLAAQHSAPRSFSRTLPELVFDQISGHRHFMYLQDAVFRVYADFKRDPSTAADTRLIFHNPMDSEHWLVAPRDFRLTRQASSPFTYRYNIELLVLDTAESVSLQISEDKSILAEMKDGLASIQGAIDLATGALRDLSALAGEIKGVVKDFVKTIDGITTLINAAQDFVKGVTSLIQAPFALVTSQADAIEAGLAFYGQILESGAQITQIPDTTLQSIRQLGDALNQFGLHPESFETPAQAQLRAIKDSQQISTASNSAALDAAAAAAPPQTLAAVDTLGTAYLPGDASRARAQVQSGTEVRTYTGTQQYVVAKGDTLANLAARFLGDARLWQYLAITNGLKPPFVDAQASAGLSGAVGLGASILIPNFAQPPERQPLLPVLGVPPDADADVHLLGADLALAPVGLGSPGNTGSSQLRLDFIIDRERGSTDVKRVQGKDNLCQAMTTRLITEQGEDILYQQVGVRRIVALNVATVDLETARYRIQEALLADPRIAAVRSIDFTVVGDQVAVDAVAVVRGFGTATPVRTLV